MRGLFRDLLQLLRLLSPEHNVLPPKTCDKAMPQHESPALSNSGSQLSFYNVCKDDPIKAKRSVEVRK